MSPFWGVDHNKVLSSMSCASKKQFSFLISYLVPYNPYPYLTLQSLLSLHLPFFNLLTFAYLFLLAFLTFPYLSFHIFLSFPFLPLPNLNFQDPISGILRRVLIVPKKRDLCPGSDGYHQCPTDWRQNQVVRRPIDANSFQCIPNWLNISWCTLSNEGR